MDSNQFDRLSKLFGARKTRRQSLTVMAGAAAAAVGFGQSANAGTLTCVITCPSDDYWNTDTNSCTATGTLPSPTSNGLCGSQAIICNLAGNVTLPLGPNTVSCQTIDSASSCSFTVNVYDDNPPIATCPANISETADGPMAVTFPDATVATMCGTDNFAIDCDHNSGDVFPLGTTTVTCNVIFPSGGFEPTGCSFTVTLAPAPPTETATVTPTEIPATEDPATTVPEPTDTEVPATEVPATVVPATNVPAPTATTAPVTSLPNTGSGGNDGHGGASKLLPLAVVGAGAAALVRLGLRKPADTPEV